MGGRLAARLYADEVNKHPERVEARSTHKNAGCEMYTFSIGGPVAVSSISCTCRYLSCLSIVRSLAIIDTLIPRSWMFLHPFSFIAATTHGIYVILMSA